MKFGLMAQIQIPRPWSEVSEREAFWNNLEQAVHAEAVGLDYYWLTEQHFYVEIGHSACPEVFLAALSQRTERIRLGLGVVLLPVHHPFQVAERVATLDILSRGRVDLGTGRGTAGYVVEGFGVEPDAARGIADESLRAILRIFESPRFEGFEGEHFDLPPRQVIPRVVQQPHPPLWAAASNLETYARAGSLGLGVVGVTRVLPEEAAPAIADYWSAVRDIAPRDCLGAYPNPHAGAFAITCCDTDDRAGRAAACAAARWYYGDNDAELNHLRFGTARGVRQVSQIVASRNDDELIEDAIVIGGNPDTCSRVVERWARAGLDQMVFMIQAGYTTHDQVMRSLDLLGRHVIPRFAD